MDTKIKDFEGNELNEEVVKDRIQRLRTLVLADENYKLLRTDDAFLLRFLHRLSFNVEKAFKGIRYYYNYIIEEHDWLPLDDPQTYKHLVDMNMRFILPHKDKQGKRIILFKTDTIDPSTITLQELSKLETLLLETILDEPDVQSTGLCVIIDCSGFSMRMMSWLTPTNIQRSIRRLDNLIMKDGVFHVVGTSFLMSAAINFIMPLLPKLIKDRVQFHYDYESLHEHIDPGSLPTEFGGDFELDYEDLNEEFWKKTGGLNQSFQHVRDIIKNHGNDE